MVTIKEKTKLSKINTEKEYKPKSSPKKKSNPEINSNPEIKTKSEKTPIADKFLLAASSIKNRTVNTITNYKIMIERLSEERKLVYTLLDSLERELKYLDNDRLDNYFVKLKINYFINVLVSLKQTENFSNSFEQMMYFVINTALIGKNTETMPHYGHTVVSCLRKIVDNKKNTDIQANFRVQLPTILTIIHSAKKECMIRVPKADTTAAEDFEDTTKNSDKHEDEENY
jgi:plasmid maintenance system killer protein